MPTEREEAQLRPLDCSDLQNLGYTRSGHYNIYPLRSGVSDVPVEVCCDMDTEGKGWTVGFQLKCILFKLLKTVTLLQHQHRQQHTRSCCNDTPGVVRRRKRDLLFSSTVVFVSSCKSVYTRRIKKFLQSPFLSSREWIYAEVSVSI